ncbi:MAG: hypothetical protein M0R74_12780 [Dehalococcoidia bacterium]|jgi:hypothetical protein|nr:hypothetical protein [Dehalococcoidia bacterium]
MRLKKDILKRLTEKHAKLSGYGEDGMSGILKIKEEKGKEDIFRFIFSWGMGWEHLSVSLPNRIPTWYEMCRFKDIFWGEDEWCVQFHPPKSEHVNNCSTCLHLWKPKNRPLPVPPSILVGIK